MALSAKLQEVFDGVAASALDKQLYLGDRLGEHNWQFTQGVLTFACETGERLSYAAQILGTESDKTRTWFWAWANEASAIPPAQLRAALAVKNWGAQQQVPELVTPSLSVQAVSGHVLAMIASGLSDASFYYRGPYDGGAVFLLVKDPQYAPTIDDPLVRIASVFPELIGSAEMPISDPRAAFIEYLSFYGLPTLTNDSLPEGRGVIGKAGGRVVLAVFDEQGRLTHLSVEEDAD